VTTTSTSDAGELRAWIQAGQRRRAGEWLVRTYAGEVLGLCAAMVRDRAAAEDLTQEVFGAAFTGLDQFRGDASVRTWLLAIARNRCIDHLRARRRDPWAGIGDDLEPDDQPDDTPLPGDLLGRRAEVEAALAALGEGERALVVLRFRHGLDHAELAAAFGLREGTVRMRISRALRRMREALEAPRGELERALAVAEDRMAPAATPLGAAAPPPAPGGPPPAPAAAAPRRRAAAGFATGITRTGLAATPVHPLTAFLTATTHTPSSALTARLDALAAAL